MKIQKWLMKWFHPLVLRSVFLWPLYHHHLCQCRAGSDRKPDTSFLVNLPSKLHSTGLPFTAAVHHRETSVHRKPLPHHLRPQIFPLQGRSAEYVLGCLYSGEYIQDQTWHSMHSHLSFNSADVLTGWRDDRAPVQRWFTVFGRDPAENISLSNCSPA